MNTNKNRRINGNTLFLLWMAAIMFIGMLAMTGCGITQTVKGVGDIAVGVGSLFEGIGNDMKRSADGYEMND